MVLLGVDGIDGAGDVVAICLSVQPLVKDLISRSRRSSPERRGGGGEGGRGDPCLGERATTGGAVEGVGVSDRLGTVSGDGLRPRNDDAPLASLASRNGDRLPIIGGSVVAVAIGGDRGDKTTTDGVGLAEEEEEAFVSPKTGRVDE